MPIAKITGQGLFAIALAVSLLWGILLAERGMMRRATAERAVVMRSVEQHKFRRSQPVVYPRHQRPRVSRSVNS